MMRLAGPFLRLSGSILLALHLGHQASAEVFGHVPELGTRLGAGFNTISPEKVYPACITADNECQTGIKGSISCVAPSTEFKDPSADTDFAPETTLSVREIRSKYEYFRELNITASLSGSYGIFSGSASYSYHSLDDINEDSISWAITAKSLYGSSGLSNPGLKPSLAELPPRKIVDICGPQYVAEVDRGVLASVLYTFHSRSERKLRETSASLSAGLNAGVWSAQGGGSFSEVVKSFMAHGQVSVRVFTIGGDGAPGLRNIILVNPTDLDKVKQTISDYVAKQTLARSTILGFRTSSFGKLIGAPEVDPDYNSYVFFLERINEYRITLQDKGKRLYDYLLNNADFANSGGELGQMERDLSCELNLINTRATMCRLWTDTLTKLLSNGVSDDDETVRKLMTHDLYTSASTNQQFGLGRLANIVPLGDATTAAAPTCSVNLKQAQQASEIVTRLSEGVMTIGEVLESEGPPPCGFTTNVNLLRKLNAIPEFPFVLYHYIDGFDDNFIDQTKKVLYLKFEQAAVVEIVYLKDGEGNIIKAEYNQSGLDDFAVSYPVDQQFQGGDLEVEVHSTSGNVYRRSIFVPAG